MTVLSPLNYTGSKSLLMPQLLELIPETRHCCDVFVGGGGFLANAVPRYETFSANDIIRPVVRILMALCREDSADRLLAHVVRHAVAKDDPEGYASLRSDFNASEADTASERVSMLYALLCCCTNNMLRFNKSGGFNQTFGKRSFTAASRARADAFTDALSPHAGTTKFFSRDFERTLRNINKDTFYYLDPPYTGTGAGYNAFWAKDADTKLQARIAHIASRGAVFGLSGTIVDGVAAPLVSWGMDNFNTHYLDMSYAKVSRKDKVTQEVYITNATS